MQTLEEYSTTKDNLLNSNHEQIEYINPEGITFYEIIEISTGKKIIAKSVLPITVVEDGVKNRDLYRAQILDKKTNIPRLAFFDKDGKEALTKCLYCKTLGIPCSNQECNHFQL